MLVECDIKMTPNNSENTAPKFGTKYLPREPHLEFFGNIPTLFVFLSQLCQLFHLNNALVQLPPPVFNHTDTGGEAVK